MATISIPDFIDLTLFSSGIILVKIEPSIGQSTVEDTETLIDPVAAGIEGFVYLGEICLINFRRTGCGQKSCY
jgi:hypothetical protein